MANLIQPLLGVLLVQTFGVLAHCPGFPYNAPMLQIVDICGTHLDICATSDNNLSPVQTFDRYMGFRLWRKAKRMDRSFNSLLDQFRPSGVMPHPNAECDSCMETLIPDTLPRGNITAQQMRESLLTDFTMLGKVVKAFTLIRQGCEQNVGIRRKIRSAENTAKQLMCEIRLSLSSVGGTSPCDPIYPVLTSWCQTNSCFEWEERNYLVMETLIDTSQAMKSKYNNVASSHVIYSTN